MSDEIELKEEADEDIEKSLQLTEELETLRQQKEQQLSETKTSQPDTPRRNDALTGYVTGIDIDDSGLKRTAVLTVEFSDGGEKKEKTFKYQTPNNPEEYSTDNTLIRLLLTFSDDGIDVSKLLHREVWIKKENNNYTLDIPEKPTKPGKVKQKAKRWLVNHKIANWDGTLTTSPKLAFGFGLHSIALTITFIIAIQLFSTITLTGFLATILISVFGLVLGGPILVLVHEIVKNWIDEKLTAYTATGLTMTAIFTGIIFFAGYQPVAMATQPGSELTTVGNIFYLYAITSALAATLFSGVKPYKKAYDLSNNTLSALKKKYNKWRGVEHVKER